jgi:RimJ/RimL family protein N-acetyltransferase
MNTTHSFPLGQIAIRAAAVEDAAPLRDLRLEALSNSPESFGGDIDSAANETAEHWRKRILVNNAEGKGAFFIAQAKGQLVGMAGISRGSWQKTRHSGVIWGVYVNSEWRGLRIADALLNACVGWAREQALVQVKLAVVATNMPAIRCYARCGFSVYGVDPKVILYNGVYFDELLMVKVL